MVSLLLILGKHLSILYLLLMLNLVSLMLDFRRSLVLSMNSKLLLKIIRVTLLVLRQFSMMLLLTSILVVMMSALEISLSMTSIPSILITKQKVVILRLYVYSLIRINYLIILLLILLQVQKTSKMDKSLFLQIVKINNCGRDSCPFRFFNNSKFHLYSIKLKEGLRL